MENKIELLMPGRELDALIAEKVMWWNGVVLNGHGYPPGNTNFERFPEYSTDIAAAWEVVEKLRSMEISLDIFIGMTGIRVTASNDEPGKCWVLQTAPHAICLAALKAARL